MISVVCDFCFLFGGGGGELFVSAGFSDPPIHFDLRIRFIFP